METRNSYLIPIVMATCMALGLFMGNMLSPQVEGSGSSMGELRYEKIQDIIKILDQRYVDSVDSENLFEKTIADMLHSLDPHSNYIPAEDLVAMNEVIEGKFGGVGVRFFIIRDTLCITNVLPGSPAEMADLKDGDKIISIESERIAGKKMTNEEVMSMLKGIEGTEVGVTVLRNKKEIKKKIIRGSIPVKSVVANYMLTGNIGYVRIDQFSVETSTEFSKLSQELVDQGMTKLIIDLRNNGGGVLTGATEVADEFLKEQIPIVETRGENSPKYVYRSTKDGKLLDIDLAILINSNSASASEILAGAIQDNDRGIIIGRRSFGKGLVQEDFMLKDGSTVRLTVARYYTPTGRCIQKPYTEDYHAYYEEQQDRLSNGEMYSIDSTLLVDSLRFVTPKGKIVYGGGGIMPDVFVPYDTSGGSWFFTELRYSPSFNTFAFDFISDKRSKWDDPKTFNQKFNVTDKILDAFINYAEQNFSIRVIQSELEHSKQLIKATLKAEIARQLWVEQGYYIVKNSNDKDIQRAIKELKK